MIIYLTSDIINNKKYIGKDRNNNPSYLGGGVLLKKAIKTYGRNNFVKETLEICSSIKQLKEREIYWLEYYDAANNPDFYNLTNKSYGSVNGPTKTESYLNRGILISKSRKGNHYPMASKALSGLPKPKTGDSLRGKPKTEEHKRNLSIAKTGIPSKRKGKPDLKQKGKPKPGAGGKGIPHIGAGPKEGKHIVDCETGIIYKSVKDVLKTFRYHKRKIYNILKEKNGRFKYNI